MRNPRKKPELVAWAFQACPQIRSHSETMDSCLRTQTANAWTRHNPARRTNTHQPIIDRTSNAKQCLEESRNSQQHRPLTCHKHARTLCSELRQTYPQARNSAYRAVHCHELLGRPQTSGTGAANAAAHAASCGSTQRHIRAVTGSRPENTITCGFHVQSGYLLHVIRIQTQSQLTVTGRLGGRH